MNAHIENGNAVEKLSTHMDASLRYPRRRWLFWSFLFIVVLPTLLAAVYFGLIAAPRYVATAQFVVRSANAGADPTVSGVGMLAGLTSGSQSASDAHIVKQFIRSPALVERIGRDLDLMATYSKDADWLSSASTWCSQLEELVEYWRSRARVEVDPLSSIITLNVEAFSPESALEIAKITLTQSRQMLAELSQQERADSLAEAGRQLEVIGNRREQVRQRLDTYRKVHKIVDVGQASQVEGATIGQLEAEQIDLKSQIEVLQKYLRQDDVRMALMKSRLQALQNRIAELRSLGSKNQDGDKKFAMVGEFEALQAEMDLSEKLYAAATGSYLRAASQADLRDRYLVLFVEPQLPQKALLPERGRDIVLVLVLTLIGWVVVVAVVAAVRDHIGFEAWR